MRNSAYCHKGMHRSMANLIKSTRNCMVQLLRGKQLDDSDVSLYRALLQH